MARQATNDDGITIQQIDAAYAVLEQLRENFQKRDIDSLADTMNEAHYLVQQYERNAEFTERSHSVEVGEYYIDDTEPTPSPEANTVEVVELIDQRADEFVIEETGNTVAEHNGWYPDDDLVVAGRYPNMGKDRIWHFPESRLR